MFEVIATGTNLNYGKKGEKRKLNDNQVLSAIKNGWVKDHKIVYLGSPANSAAPRVDCREIVKPIKIIDLATTLDDQNKRIDRLVAECQKIHEVNNRYLELLTK